jgi:predicted DCC family thiol-disulfide oxidoreductase YuxK
MPDIMIFDGVCNLCTHSVQFILKHESEPRIQFTAVQSPAGARLLRKFGFSADDISTFVLVSDGKIYIKTSAAILIAKHLKGPWSLLRVLWLVPRPIRDWLYDVIARNRYAWFGRTSACMVPAPELSARFLCD